LSHHTKLLLGDLLKLLVDNEVALYRSKEQLRTRVTWNNYDAWNSVDKAAVGRLSQEDVRYFLKEHR